MNCRIKAVVDQIIRRVLSNRPLISSNLLGFSPPGRCAKNVKGREILIGMKKERR